ncbi:MAG: TRAP transporter large permease subunit [Hyphomicrobiales bacterium]|nr:TRAP transporter large permease subunit [Hyphomicrobiales bacterium]
MTDPQVALTMLGVFIFIILLGFPIAFTLVAMGVGFGYYAYFDAGRMWRAFNRAVEAGADPSTLTETWIGGFFNNRIFDLLVNQTYSVMSNDVLTAVPLFLFMGYIVERANIIDRLFYTLNIASRRMPASMAIAALTTCALFATATGIVGAVVTLMGLLAFPAMLKVRYNTSFAAGVICAGGCLGILIPPSIMLIVYAATSSVSIVQLYAGAMIPGFLLAGMYIIYVIARAWFDPTLAPKPRAEETAHLTGEQIFTMLLASFFPLAFLILSVLGAILFGLATPSEAASIGALGGLVLASLYQLNFYFSGTAAPPPWSRMRLDGKAWNWVALVGTGAYGAVATLAVVTFFGVFFGFSGQITGWPPGVWIVVAIVLMALFRIAFDPIVAVFAALSRPSPAHHMLWLTLKTSAYVLIATPLVKLALWSLGLSVPVLSALLDFAITWSGFAVGLSVLTLVVSTAMLWVIEAGLGGGIENKFIKLSGAGAFAGLALAALYYFAIQPYLPNNDTTLRVLDLGMLFGAPFAGAVLGVRWQGLSESVYLTVRTTAMVCWLFVGSWTFSSVFSYLGGEQLISDFVLGLDLSPIMFLIIAQIIIFLLGWPLEWSEIIIIFVPIFLPLLPHFNIDPLFFGILIALNLQTSFLTPPMAMAAYYLKGVSPPGVELVQIFKGVMPYLAIIVLAMAILYIFPGIAMWLPEQFYGR